MEELAETLEDGGLSGRFHEFHQGGAARICERLEVFKDSTPEPEQKAILYSLLNKLAL